MLTSAKLRGPWYQKTYFLKLHMCVNLHTKFQVSNIILTSFRQGGFYPHISKQAPKKAPLMILKIKILKKKMKKMPGDIMLLYIHVYHK